jgi:redox-sensitive bicupin YhaK (pirin superfamily)
MTITVRKSEDRGLADHGWLQSRHSFSFADYRDPAHVQFGPLRVINEDRVAPGAGFGTHGHRDMEILSWVLDGALAHKDSLGNGSTIRPGELQHMSAGTGIMHSEFNASASEPVHFLQIWIIPEAQGVAPGYAQKDFSAAIDGRPALIASRVGRAGSLAIHRDADVYAARLARDDSFTHETRSGRKLWIQVARGAIELDGTRLEQGDGAAIEAVERLAIRAASDGEILLFDMAA